jgi:hypothetical protein
VKGGINKKLIHFTNNYLDILFRSFNDAVSMQTVYIYSDGRKIDKWYLGEDSDESDCDVTGSVLLNLPGAT